MCRPGLRRPIWPTGSSGSPPNSFVASKYDALDDEEDELNERQVVEMGDVPITEVLERLTGAGERAVAALRSFDRQDPQANLVYMTVVDHFPEHATELRALSG